MNIIIDYILIKIDSIDANVRVLGEEADKQDHIPDASKMVTNKKQTLN